MRNSILSDLWECPHNFQGYHFFELLTFSIWDQYVIRFDKELYHNSLKELFNLFQIGFIMLYFFLSKILCISIKAKVITLFYNFVVVTSLFRLIISRLKRSAHTLTNMSAISEKNDWQRIWTHGFVYTYGTDDIETYIDKVFLSPSYLRLWSREERKKNINFLILSFLYVLNTMYSWC